ncbi:MAG: DNA alkylation repair protein [Candidatus Curtissbacteria bacterium]|nr:DNA alkylation repair protein [Candidatus Curtissbacteria bacterium]
MDLEKLKDPQRAKDSEWFFKTGPGQYGEGDIFLGITVPKQREVAKKYSDLSLSDIQKLLLSKIHEHRFVALAILVNKFKKADNFQREEIFDFYIKNAKNINNWDLVDSSAPYIVGEYLAGRGKAILYKLAGSGNLWERRIAIVSSSGFIKRGEYEDTFAISEILLSDSCDLIHKAVGWMLREVGKRNSGELEKFLKKHQKNMPRTMLRYAIERFDVNKKRFYMAK